MHPAECLRFESHLDLLPGSKAAQETCCQNYLRDFSNRNAKLQANLKMNKACEESSQQRTVVVLKYRK